jgi:hypothetical protein
VAGVRRGRIVLRDPLANSPVAIIVEKIAGKIAAADPIVEINPAVNNGVVSNGAVTSAEKDADPVAIEAPTAGVIAVAIEVAAKAVVRIAAKAVVPAADRAPSTGLRRTSNWSG